MVVFTSFIDVISYLYFVIVGDIDGVYNGLIVDSQLIYVCLF